MTRKDFIPYLFAILALIFGTFFDYSITDVLYQPNSLFAIMFERLVLLPIQFMVMFTICLLYRRYHHIIFPVLAILTSLYILYHTLTYWIPFPNSLEIGCIGVIAFMMTIITLYFTARISDAWLQKYLSFFVFFTVVLLCATCITSVIKLCWGRIRYRDMESIHSFCVWYKPCGHIGNHSFPSGHTTAITSLLCLLQWKQNRYAKPSVQRHLFVYGMVVAMILSRMMLGAHFLSDTAVGFIITYTCYLVIRGVFQRRGYL